MKKTETIDSISFQQFLMLKGIRQFAYTPDEQTFYSSVRRSTDTVFANSFFLWGALLRHVNIARRFDGMFLVP